MEPKHTKILGVANGLLIVLVKAVKSSITSN